MSKSLVTISVVSSDADEIINGIKALAEKYDHMATPIGGERAIRLRYLADQVHEQVKAQR